MKRPEKFFKYRPLAGTSALHVGQSVFDHKFFFDSPNNFNDPFECLPRFIFEGTPAERVTYITDWLVRNQGMPHGEAQIKALQMELSGGRPDLDFFFDTYRDESVAKLPMYCVSEVSDNILMWSHYANNHTGVCFEFDGQASVFEHAHRVVYDEQRVTVDMAVKLDATKVAMAAITKSRDWHYEKEWRVVEAGSKSGVRTWPETVLTAIILGDRISESDRSRVKGWALRRSPSIALRQATISRSKFKVDITDL